MAKIRENFVGTLDIGSNKCCVLFGLSRSNDELEIIGFGEAKSDGSVLKGDILDMELLMNQLTLALNDAEQMANISINESSITTVNISGTTMSFIPSVGSVTIKNADQRITEDDYNEALENAERFNMPENKSHLGTFESYSVINNSKKTAAPIGQSANKLDVHTLLQFVGVNELKNTKHLMADLGIEENNVDYIFSGIGGLYGCLSESERKNGSIFIDLGAGTTEFVVVNNYIITAAGVLPLGMDHVINDLSLGLKLPMSICRNLVESGQLEQLLKSNETFWEYEINRTKYRIPSHIIELIVNARLQEIFELMKIQIYRNNAHCDIEAGGILIGGGALLSRNHEIFRNTFDCNCRTGRAIGMTGNIGSLSTPQYGTTYGLLKMAHAYSMRSKLPNKNHNPVTIAVDKFIQMFSKVKDSVKL
ncbi:MAG: cell division protein FtsA [Lentisphaeria bacterium]|nr:cell division protein FtsA [Lentisphaeria bacterium]